MFNFAEGNVQKPSKESERPETSTTAETCNQTLESVRRANSDVNWTEYTYYIHIYMYI